MQPTVLQLEEGIRDLAAEMIDCCLKHGRCVFLVRFGRRPTRLAGQLPLGQSDCLLQKRSAQGLIVIYTTCVLAPVRL